MQWNTARNRTSKGLLSLLGQARPLELLVSESAFGVWAFEVLF
jgi:hypothetical protein